MESLKFSRIFFKIFVILAGLFISWHVSFFKPFQTSFKSKSIPGTILKNDASLVSVTAGYQYQLNNFGRLFLGKHYRDLWTLPVTVPEFEARNFNVIRKGGGMQTTSFTLEDSAQQTFVLRSIDKDPVAVLPAFLWPTVLTDFVRDQISATDPFAFLVVNKLAQATGIYQDHGELVYLSPNQPAFQKYGNNTAGLYMFSQRNGQLTSFHSLKEQYVNTFDTAEMLRLIKRNPQNFSLDTAMFLKCRLFDLLISDWDRHAGQWDWAAFSAQNGTVFRPVPKDRDQAFCYYQDGFIPKILTQDFAIRKFSSFTPEFEDVTGFCQNGADLDNIFLKGIMQDVFINTALKIQKSLHDSTLQQAINQYPKEVNQAFKKERFRVLQSRRNKLRRGAVLFYQVIQNR